MFNFNDFVNEFNKQLLDGCGELLEKYTKGSPNKVNKSTIEYAIRRHKYVKIKYNDKKDPTHTDERIVGIYAYGTSKANNPCIRVFQTDGDTRSQVPGWKLMLLSRIESFELIDTQKTWRLAPDGYNEETDRGMNDVYLIAKNWYSDKEQTQNQKDIENQDDVNLNDTTSETGDDL